ncbi:MAG: 2Fe-2S iron-sulfur cluster-binding protein [Cytophagales bacterium]
MAEVIVKSIKKETQDAITIVFDVKPHAWHYEAGQFVTLSINIDQKTYHRSYSFQTSPYQDPLPAITVKRVQEGKVSNYLNDHLQVGDRLICSVPQGKFTIDYKPNASQHFVFIAAGSGITPLFSMIKAVLYQMPKSTLQLIYANRDEEGIIYKKTLDQLVSQHANRLQVTHVLSQPKTDFRGLKGRLNHDKLQTLLEGNLQTNLYFLCGPEGFMEMVFATLRKLEISPRQIRQEFFKASVQPNVLGKQAKMTILHDDQTYQCEITPGDTLLDVLLDEGIDVPYSCSSGICNTCRVKCLSGKVGMTEDEGLSAQEKEAGYVLSCVGYAESDALTIKVED